jgi:hypothetical protein
MKYKTRIGLLAALLTLSLIVVPGIARAQQSTTPEPEPVYTFGSIVLSILHFPIKLGTCAGTQAIAAGLYVWTFDVAGNYEGGTNGREIGEVARRSCTGWWLVHPKQVEKDYGN